jgi:peptide/nickel transport system substrate-binding protein
MARRRLASLALALAVSMALTACSSGTKQQTAPTTPTTPAPAQSSGPKIATIGMWSSPSTFNPITYTTTYDSTILGLIYPRLLVMNDKLEFQGQLAESFTSNDKQDVFTFKLYKNAKWSDGTPITATDVAYTFQVLAHPDTPTTRRSNIDTIKGLDANGISETKDFNVTGIKVIDDKTIEFSTKTPVDKDAFFEKVGFNCYIMPKAVLSTMADKLKELDKADFSLKPTVTGGPYKFVQYVTDSNVELAPNPDFWLGKPKLDKLFVRIVNQATFAASVQKGEIDISAGAGVGEVPVADWENVSSLPTVKPVTYVAPSFQYMDINVAKPEFANAKVRQGIATAINRPLIVQRLLKGQGEVLNTPLNSANKYYRKDLQSALAYNKDEAKKLLTEGGWDFNKEVVLLTPTGNVVREQSADIIMANLQDVGMKVKIEKVDFPTRQTRGQKGDYQLSLVGFSATFDPDFSTQVMTGAGFNYGKFSNKEMDDLFTKGKQAVKFDEKKAVYDKVQELFVQQVPILPLYAVKALCVVNNRMVNVKLGPQGLTWNAWEWDVK